MQLVRSAGPQRAAWIGSAHEGFADEKCVNPGVAHARNVIAAQDAALRDDDSITRNARQQVERRFQPRFEGFEVAIVDTDERRLEG